MQLAAACVGEGRQVACGCAQGLSGDGGVHGEDHERGVKQCLAVQLVRLRVVTAEAVGAGRGGGAQHLAHDGGLAVKRGVARGGQLPTPPLTQTRELPLQ